VNRKSSAAAFGKMKKVWRNNNSSLKVKRTNNSVNSPIQRCTGRYQDKRETRSIKNELEERSKQRSTKDEAQVGGIRGGAAIDRHGWRVYGIGVWPNVSSWMRVKF